MAVDVAIVGGGIAGLATAYELSRRRLSFVVLERSARPGGVIVSEEVGDFTIDSGPDSLLIQNLENIELCYELGLACRLVKTQLPQNTYIQPTSRLFLLP